MVGESYVECLVKGKAPASTRFLKVLCIMLAIGFAAVGFLFGNTLCFVIAVAAGFGAYIFAQRSEVEYEYLYIDKEITVDKVFSKAKRKRVATYSVERMEIFAPIKSWHLDNFKNRELKDVDYSCGEEKQPDRRYVMIYEGGVRLIFEPSEAMIAAIRNVAPRKVFTD